MVIDVDEVVPLQPGEASALHAVAFQDDDRFGFGSLVGVVQYRIGEGKRAIDAGNAVAKDYAGLLCPCCAESGNKPGPSLPHRRPAARAR